ncbi:alpha/beta hydrolase domain-containing protein 17C isoform X2 [Cetorhinus maximus]
MPTTAAAAGEQAAGPPSPPPRMNGFSLGELCWLFCCPPCPSRIAAKLAFLPPAPTYTVLTDESSSLCSLHLSERADWQFSERELELLEVFFVRSGRGSRLACMFARCVPECRYTLLFSHGNAVDLGQMCSFYIGLGNRIKCNIFSYDYSGYGASSGKPSERNLYSDIDAAWTALRTSLLPARSGLKIEVQRLREWLGRSNDLRRMLIRSVTKIIPEMGYNFIQYAFSTHF